jgi:hypothetical protein
LPGSTFTSSGNDDTVAINSCYAARLSNEPGRKQRNIAHPAAEVEHAHAALETGRDEELLRPFFKESCLDLQAPLFLHAVS